MVIEKLSLYFIMTSEHMEKVASELVRYQEFVVVVNAEAVKNDTRRLALECPAHGTWYFRRVGETLRFTCNHHDHLGPGHENDPVPGADNQHLQR